MIDKSHGLAAIVDEMLFYHGKNGGVIGKVDGQELMISSAVLRVDSFPLKERIKYEVAKFRYLRDRDKS